MKLTSNSTDQFRNILEAAQIRVYGHDHGQIIEPRSRQLPWETTSVMITAVPTLELITALKRFKQAAAG
jgi:hypothetical protein